MTESGPSEPLRFSTEQIPLQDRVPIFREVAGRQLMRMDVDVLPDRPFHVDMNFHALRGLTLVSAEVSGISARRTRELTSDGNDAIALMVNLSGCFISSRSGGEASVGAGEAIFIPAEEVAGCVHPSPGRLVGVNIPRSALRSLVPRLEDRLLQGVVPKSNPALGLLTSYLSALTDQRALPSLALQDLATTHLYDLFAVILGTTRDIARIVEDRGIRAARLHAIRKDILANLSSRDLTLTALAARHRVTPRYVQMLFERDGLSLTEFILDARLALAHRLLRDPLHAERTISDLAFAAGFGDLSYFNRSFRRRYGMTPSDLRASRSRASDGSAPDDTP